jgi:hypothetical protein
MNPKSEFLKTPEAPEFATMIGHPALQRGITAAFAAWCMSDNVSSEHVRAVRDYVAVLNNIATDDPPKRLPSKALVSDLAGGVQQEKK